MWVTKVVFGIVFNRIKTWSSLFEKTSHQMHLLSTVTAVSVFPLSSTSLTLRDSAWLLANLQSLDLELCCCFKNSSRNLWILSSSWLLLSLPSPISIREPSLPSPSLSCWFIPLSTVEQASPVIFCMCWSSLFMLVTHCFMASSICSIGVSEVNCTSTGRLDFRVWKKSINSLLSLSKIGKKKQKIYFNKYSMLSA